jgi:hypothetical protein
MSRSLAGSHRTQVAICAVLVVAGVGVLAIPAAGEGRVLVPISEGYSGLTVRDEPRGAGKLSIF